jgi:hypothetical protein
MLNVLLTGPILESECALINLKRSTFRGVAQSIGKVTGEFGNMTAVIVTLNKRTGYFDHNEREKP